VKTTKERYDRLPQPSKKIIKKNGERELLTSTTKEIEEMQRCGQVIYLFPNPIFSS